MTKQINLDKINAQFNLCNATLIITRQYSAGNTYGLCYRLLQGGVERKGATLLISMNATSTMTFVQLVRLLAVELGIATSLDVYQSIRVVPGMGGSFESVAVVFPEAIAPAARAQIFSMMVEEHATLRAGEVALSLPYLDYGLNVQVMVNGAQHSKLYPHAEMDFAACVHNHSTNQLTAPQVITRPRLVLLYKASIMRLVAHTNR